MKIGDTVLITGGGSIGLLIMEIALRNGASKVMVSDPIAEKRKLALQLGTDAVVDPLKEKPAGSIQKIHRPVTASMSVSKLQVSLPLPVSLFYWPNATAPWSGSPLTRAIAMSACR